MHSCIDPNITCILYKNKNSPEANKNKSGILVEEVEDHSGQAVIAPVSMNKDQPFHKAKPADRKISRHDSLHSLLKIERLPRKDHFNNKRIICVNKRLRD